MFKITLKDLVKDKSYILEFSPQVIHGNVTLDELMSALLHAGESYQSQVGVEVVAEQESAARSQVKDEQHLAYQEALLADQEKEVARKEQEAEARMMEQVEEAKRQSEEEAREKEARDKKRDMEEASGRLPTEPSQDCGQQLANIRFRTPDGQTLARLDIHDIPTLLYRLTFSWDFFSESPDLGILGSRK